MRETTTINALDDDLVVAVLRLLDDHKFRATVACVCKTWRACVKRSWDKAHICFSSMETLEARLSWLHRQGHPLVLQSLELHGRVYQPCLPYKSVLRLERFGALRHLDIQSVCGKAPVEVEGPKYSTRLEEKLKRLGLQQAHVKQLAALSITLQTLRLVYEEDVPKHTPWTLDAFSALTSLTELRIGVRESLPNNTPLELAESLTGLQKLQNMDIHGTCFSVGEEKPGLLNKMFEGLTSLHLRATSMPCSDIASPNLRCLTVIMRGLNDLPVGACPQLRSLHHNAWGVTAGHLEQYMMLQTLSCEMYDRELEPVHFSLVEALMPLTRLQHLHLTQYQSGDGFSEMLSIEGLKTLRLRLVNPPQRLYFAKGFSKLTGLTAVHLRRHRTHWPDNAPFRPTFSGQVDHLPALEVLSVECVNVEAAITSHSLVEVEIGAFPRAPFQAWPLVARCNSLTRLRLKCLPAFLVGLPEACHNLRELQLTYAYAEHPLVGDDSSTWDFECMQTHSRDVETLISRLLEGGTLRVLQVEALHSSLCIDVSRLAASGLEHLALACECLRLEGRCGNSSSPPVPSIHLFTWGRESSDESSDLQAYIPMLESTEAAVGHLKSWRKPVLYKHGPRHDLDLVEEDLEEELMSARDWRQDLYASGPSSLDEDYRLYSSDY